jgi:hypothetical protein
VENESNIIHEILQEYRKLDSIFREKLQMKKDELNIINKLNTK